MPPSTVPSARWASSQNAHTDHEKPLIVYGADFVGPAIDEVGRGGMTEAIPSGTCNAGHFHFEWSESLGPYSKVSAEQLAGCGKAGVG